MRSTFASPATESCSRSAISNRKILEVEQSATASASPHSERWHSMASTLHTCSHICLKAGHVSAAPFRSLHAESLLPVPPNALLARSRMPNPSLSTPKLDQLSVRRRRSFSLSTFCHPRSVAGYGCRVPIFGVTHVHFQSAPFILNPIGLISKYCLGLSWKLVSYGICSVRGQFTHT